jgi:polar amino acid transport system substrate-binding protein
MGGEKTMVKMPRCFAALTLLLPTAAFASPPMTLRICYEITDSLPFFAGPTAVDPTGQGLLNDLIMSAAKQAELHIELQRQPWKRCILQLQQGQVDGIFAAIWQPERDSWGQFPGRDAKTNAPLQRTYRLWQVDYPIIRRNGSPLVWDGQQFSGTKNGLSAPLGYVANQRLAALGVLAKPTYNAEIALKMVAADRLDGFVLERQVAQTYIRNLGLQQQLSALPEPLLKADWYLPLSHQFYREHPEIAQRFWQALAEQREARSAELSARYLSTPD